MLLGGRAGRWPGAGHHSCQGLQSSTFTPVATRGAARLAREGAGRSRELRKHREQSASSSRLRSWRRVCSSAPAPGRSCGGGGRAPPRPSISACSRGAVHLEVSPESVLTRVCAQTSTRTPMSRLRTCCTHHGPSPNPGNGHRVAEPLWSPWQQGRKRLVWDSLGSKAKKDQTLNTKRLDGIKELGVGTAEPLCAQLLVPTWPVCPCLT